MNAAETEAEQGAPPSAASRRRSVARLGAVQALYQLALNPGLSAEVVVGEFRRHHLGREIDGEVYGEADEKLFSDVVRGVAAQRSQLDETIAAALSDEWPLRRLQTILRLILEAGAYELSCRLDIPPRVTLREYVAIAHAFFDGGEPALANGVLHHLAQAQRAAEL